MPKSTSRAQSHCMAPLLPGRKAQRPFALDQSQAGELVVAPRAVRRPHRLVAGFAGDVGHAHALGRHRIPKQRIVLPVGVIGGEGNARAAIKLVQHAVGHAALVLSHVDELLAARGADQRDHRAHPVR